MQRKRVKEEEKRTHYFVSVCASANDCVAYAVLNRSVCVCAYGYFVVRLRILRKSTENTNYELWRLLTINASERARVQMVIICKIYMQWNCEKFSFRWRNVNTCKISTMLKNSIAVPILAKQKLKTMQILGFFYLNAAEAANGKYRNYISMNGNYISCLSSLFFSSLIVYRAVNMHQFSICLRPYNTFCCWLLPVITVLIVLLQRLTGFTW